MAIKISGSAIIDDSRNIVNAGIITASTVSANEFIGTGDKLIFSPTVTSFSPTQGETDVFPSANISLTFDQPIYAGVGTITLRYSSGIGTIIESIGIGSTSQITISNQTLTINPSPSLPIGTSVYVVLDQGVVTNATGGGNAALDTYNFTTLNFGLISIDPSDGATNVGLDTNITLSFSSAPTRGTGTIELKSGSVDGPIIESFDAASSPRISVSGNDWILDPTSDLSFNTIYYPIIPSTAIQYYVGLNTTGASSYSFTARDVALGDAYEGGYLICQAGGTRWIVAPNTTEVTRDWYCRGDAVTTANANAACGDWFVPSCGQLQNPGYSCRIYWDSYSCTNYWSDTQLNSSVAWNVNLAGGAAHGSAMKPTSFCVRAFRCISY